ncbi:MAG: hypothetical protein Tsb0021_08600 [Chlamydiales bacterium]
MRNFIPLILCIFIASLTSGFKQKKQSKIVDYNTASERILGNAIKRVSKKYPLSLAGLGGGIDHEEKKNRVFDVMFDMQKKVTRDQARYIILDILDTFLYYANNDPEVAPFLKPYPFTHKGFHIALFIQNKDGSDVWHPEIGVVSLADWGDIRYKTQIYNGEFAEDLDIYTETVEEAREILAKQLSQGSQ